MNNDLVSRKWLTDAIRNRKTYLSYEDAKDVIDLIDNAPTVDIPKGEWIMQEGYDGDEYYECSICKDAFTLMYGTPKDNNYNFCPNCGAQMRKGGSNG